MKPVIPPQIRIIKEPEPDTPTHQRAERIRFQVRALQAEIEGRRKLITESAEQTSH